MKVPVVTICGSYKFTAGMLKAKQDLMEDGCIVFVPIKLEYPGGSSYMSQLCEKDIHDRHDQKILMSDIVFVYNENGYIGEHTQREIDFAEAHGKTIRYLVDPKEEQHSRIIRGGWNPSTEKWESNAFGNELRCSQCGCLIPDVDNAGAVCPNCNSILDI